MGPDKTAQQLNIRIYRTEPKARHPLYGVDFGPLLNHLVDEPLHGFEGSMKVETERTHEFELIFAIMLVGTMIFAKTAIERLGEHFADWLVTQKKDLNCKTDAEIRASGMASLHVDPSNLGKSKREIVKFLKKAEKNGLQIQVVIEPQKRKKRSK